MTLAAVFDKFTHAWRMRIEPVSARARLAWQQRTRREQAGLRSAALLVLAALIWVLALSPALQTVEQARRTLPALQAQATQLNSVILEAQALSRGRSGVLSPQDTEDALTSTLRTAGLDATIQSARGETGQAQWQVQFTNASASRIVEWMAGLPFVVQVQTHEVNLVRSNVDGRDRPGQLSGTVILTLAAQEAS